MTDQPPARAVRLTEPAVRPPTGTGRARLLRCAAAALVGRLPVAMTLTAFVLAARDLPGSAGLGAQLAGVSSIALGLGGPLWAVRLARRGPIRALRTVNLLGIPILLGEAVALATQAPIVVIFGLAAVQGATQGALPSGYRAALPGIATPAQLTRSCTLDVAMAEVGYVLGPLLTVALTAVLPATAVFAGMAVLAAFSAMLLHTLPAAPGDRSNTAGTLSPRAFTITAVLGTAVGLAQAGVTERAGEWRFDSATLGLLTGLLALGSACGGLLVAARHPRIPLRMAPWLLTGFAACCVGAAVAPRLWVLIVVLGLCGMPIAPTNASVSLSVLGPAGGSPAAPLAIQASVLLVAVGIGNYLGGRLVPVVSSHVVFGAAALVCLLGSGLLLSLRWTGPPDDRPARRGRGRRGAAGPPGQSEHGAPR
jgi:hypothetical protein